jgi:hypothetical protein
MKSVTLLLFLSAWISLAGEKHEHGRAELDVAIEGPSVTAEFRSPADSVLGFEHAPRTTKEKQTVSAALEILRARSGELLLLPADAGCQFQPGKASIASEAGGHQDVEASLRATCRRPLLKGEIRFAFGRHFPEIRQLVVQVVGTGFQTGATITGGNGTIRFGP